MDLTFHLKQGRFNYRVGAIIVHKEKLLLMRNTEAPYVYTVGGRVHFDETTEEAVVRETREETGVTLEVERPLCFQEQFFDEEVTGEHVHEIAVYYLMKDSDALEALHCESVTERGEKEALFWIPLSDIGTVPFVPKSVGKILKQLPEQFIQIVEIDNRM